MRRRLLGNRRGQAVNTTANTFIGGVGSTINTPELMAALLQNDSDGTDFSASNISNFLVKGNDIEFYTSVNYRVRYQAFYNNTLITYYSDPDNFCKRLSAQAFRGASNLANIKLEGLTALVQRDFMECPLLKKAIFPNCTSVGAGLGGYSIDVIADSLGITTLYIPKVTTIGVDTGDQLAFRRTNVNKKIYAHPSMATINNGGVEGDLVGHNVVYVQNFTPPSAITNLSHSAGVLNFTPPASTNALDFYEVHVNGFYKQDISGSGATVTGFNAGDKVEVYACDIYYNRSKSNEITI